MKVRKPFDQETHGANDAIGKKAVLQFLKQMNVNAEENPDQYGVDIIVKDRERTYEVERRPMWRLVWPFDTVHIPERKTKFLKPDMVYAVVNVDCDKIMLCSSETILKYPQVEVPNKSIVAEEYFYDVPLNEWSTFDVKE
tara:strand:- start:177 stop:596 length:420 start_codon:yes stop_codon:yes gene_type:complete